MYGIHMGKKKRQKMKELSVAIAESSSIQQGAETGIQPQAPRKRGRPRKIIVVESHEEKKIEAPVEEEAAAQGGESSMKKEGQQQEGSSAACMSIIIDTKEEEIQLPKGEPSTSRSRARRKSKPRKST